MIRGAQIVIVMTFGPAVLLGQPTADQRDRSQRGILTLDELRKEPVTYKLDIPYADTDNPRQRLDLYLPKVRKADKLPVIVFIHGGGWKNGNKSTGAGRLMPLMRSGNYAGVSVGYRLSGEATWPAQIHDCKAAVRWVRANAATHGFDPKRIAVWGRSAGGHLVLMLGFTDDVPQLEGNLGPHTDVDSKVACVANYFGVSEFMALIGQPSDIDRTKADAPEAKLFGGPLRANPQIAKAASPITYVNSSAPPVLTIHGDLDPTVPYDQAVRLDAALQKAGVPSYFITVKGAGHGDFPPAAEQRTEMFFAKYLLGKDAKVSSEVINKP